MSSMRNHRKRSHRSEKERQAARAGMTRFAPVKAERGLSMSLYRPGRHRRGRGKAPRVPPHTNTAPRGGGGGQKTAAE